MEAEKCNLPHNTHFSMQRHLLHVRRASSACRCTFFACRELAPHRGGGAVCWRADTQLHMRRYLLGVRRPLFQTITVYSFHYPTSINSSVELGVLNLLRSLFSRHCDFYKAVTEERPGVKSVASETRSSDGQNREPERSVPQFNIYILVSYSY